MWPKNSLSHSTAKGGIGSSSKKIMNIWYSIEAGLYYHDFKDREIMMVSTVDGNMEGYTNR